MSSAEELRRISFNSRNETTKAQLTDVIKECTQRAKLGHNECFYYESLTNSTRNYLLKEGYIIRDFSSQRDGTCYKISW